MIFNLSYKSILNRKTSFLLSVFSIAISVVLLLGIQRIVSETKNHFLNTINQTDIIVAASNGSLDILLKLIFHIGDGLEELEYSSYEEVSKLDEVAWSVPLSVGDSFRGFSAVGTNADYFRHYKYANNQSLEFAEGGNFDGFFDLIVGSNAAKKLHLKLGESVYLSHGDTHEHHEHKNRAFVISGILKPSFTPNDDLVFIQLKTDEAMHLEWQSGHFVDMHISNEELSKMDIQPKHISGMLLGLKNRAQILEVEDKINHLKNENLKAVIPAKALAKLYKIMKQFEDIFMLISSMVFVGAIFTMLASMFSTLNERRREMAVLRSLGANIKIIFALFASEALFIVLGGIVLGNVLLTALLAFMPQNISFLPSLYELFMLLVMGITALLASLIPAIKSYRNSLYDGLSIKL